MRFIGKIFHRRERGKFLKNFFANLAPLAVKNINLK
jgi:hypothetical protein